MGEREEGERANEREGNGRRWRLFLGDIEGQQQRGRAVVLREGRRAEEDAQSGGGRNRR